MFDKKIFSNEFDLFWTTTVFLYYYDEESKNLPNLTLN
jgi:hypothetical protein